MPERVQLRRTRGWRKPEGAVVVARPGRWGNPFVVGQPTPHGITTVSEGIEMLTLAVLVTVGAIR